MNDHRNRFWRQILMTELLICLVAVVLGMSRARADELWPIGQRFSVGLGVFLLDTDTTVRLDATNRDRGTEINLEDDFGFQSQDRFRIDGYWRFLERQKLRFMYFSSSLGSSRDLSRTIRFGDTTFPVSAFVRADLDISIIEVAYEYSFLRRDSFELAGTIGLHNLSVTAQLTAAASSVAGSGGIDLLEKADGDGPLPVIGLRGIWALSDHFYFDAQAQFFALEVDNYDGSLEDYKVSFVWQPLHNVGVGIGYNEFVTRLDVEDDRFLGRLRFRYGGPLAFVTVSF